MTTASTQLPIPFDGFDIEPTPAMLHGTQVAWQCGWCGTVVIIPGSGAAKPRVLTKADPCPSCKSTAGWWRQEIGSVDALCGWRWVG